MRTIRNKMLGRMLTLVAGMLILSCGVIATAHAQPQSVDPLGIQVVGSTKLLADSPAALQVIVVDHSVVTDHSVEAPAVGADVTIRLTDADGKNARPLYRGRTDTRGIAEVRFTVPEAAPGDYLLQIRARSGRLIDVASQVVQIYTASRILLTTDKPIYQPGQIMHLRALALKQPTMQAVAARDITLEVSDAKSNKVFKRATRTNDFGIVSADFQLADEVNMGRYIVKAILGTEEVEKTVTVSRYVLPKFKATVKTDRDYYLPRDTVKGTVQADYFFGKPVADSKVQVSVKTFDVQLNEIAKLEGRTDANGAYEFETRLPESFVGQPIEQGNAYLQFDVKVTDQAQHTESVTHTATVAAAPLTINAVAETGRLIPGVENVIYVIVSRPNGEPCPATVRLNGVAGPGVPENAKLTQTVQTDSLGIAEVRFTPPATEATAGADGIMQGGLPNMPVGFAMPMPGGRVRRGSGNAGGEGPEYTFDLAARAKDGATATKKVNLSTDAHASDQVVLVRTDKALYHVGDSIEATILTPTLKGSAYVDLVKERQTILTQTVEISNGRGHVAIPVGLEAQGTVYLSAYKITPQQDIVRNTRPLFVQPASDLNIDVKPDKDTYKPGSEAKIVFAVSDASGKPIAAALGITVVDEAVFALQEIQPGMEKVFFYLEQELMKPRYEIHTMELPRIITEFGGPGGGTGVSPVRSSSGRDARSTGADVQEAAKVMFASATLPDISSFRVDSYAARLSEARQKWAEQMQPKLSAIQASLQKLYEAKKGGNLTTSGEIIAALKGVGLKDEDLLDLWGTPVRLFPPVGQNDRLWWVVVQSAGPDRKFDTSDDLVLTTGGQVFGGVEEARRSFGVRGGREVFMLGGEMMPMAAAAAPGAGGMGGGMPGMVFKAARDGAEVASGPVPQAGAAAPAVKVREFFPETMYVEPALITDGSGKATLSIPMADSITSWRLAAMANSQAGLLGSTTKGLRCFQDFFIDIDLPVSLTQHDQVSIPVAVYNYLPEKQKVSLELSVEDWFSLSGAPQQTMDIGANDVDVAYFTISAKAIGRHKLTVHGIGSKMSDAISREIEIRPDGKQVETTVNDRLSGNVTKTINLPADAVAGASTIFVKVYPGIFSQIVEGLDSILQMPFGCFEQTSSTTYPNILVLDYLKKIKKASPEVQMKAEGFINTGYQRLVSFEVPGGGFSWFGQAPANKILTAYGVMEFHDMAAVHEVDPNLITRTQKWLLSKQEGDGSYKPDESYLHQESWGRIQNSSLPPTAYITWALAHSGCKEPGVAKSVQYVRQHWQEAKEPYTLAIAGNALVAADQVLAKGDLDDATIAALDALRGMAKTEGDKMWWESGISGITHSSGKSADLEATGLAALAFIQSGRYPDVAGKVLTYLIAAKDPSGTWYSTQATVLALRALLLAQSNSTQKANAELEVLVNGQSAGAHVVDNNNADMLWQVDCKKLVKTGDNAVQIKFGGQGTMLYQIVGRYFVPWGAVQPSKQAMAINVAYDKTQLAKDDTVKATATITNNAPAQLGMVVVDLGIPPGFSADPGDFAELVDGKKIDKFRMTDRQIIVYLEKMTANQTVTFSYNLKARFPIKAKTPKSTAYEYYNPENRADAKPVDMDVR